MSKRVVVLLAVMIVGLAAVSVASAGGNPPPPQECVDTNPSPYHSTCPEPPKPNPNHGCPDGYQLVIIEINQYHSRSECRQLPPPDDECEYVSKYDRTSWIRSRLT